MESVFKPTKDEILTTDHAREACGLSSQVQKFISLADNKLSEKHGFNKFYSHTVKYNPS